MIFNIFYFNQAVRIGLVFEAKDSAKEIYVSNHNNHKKTPNILMREFFQNNLFGEELENLRRKWLLKINRIETDLEKY